MPHYWGSGWCMWCDVAVKCRMLLDAGCNINRRTREGTALHEAIAHGHVDIVSMLLSVSVFVQWWLPHITITVVSCSYLQRLQNWKLYEFYGKFYMGTHLHHSNCLWLWFLWHNIWQGCWWNRSGMLLTVCECHTSLHAHSGVSCQ